MASMLEAGRKWSGENWCNKSLEVASVTEKTCGSGSSIETAMTGARDACQETSGNEWDHKWYPFKIHFSTICGSIFVYWLCFQQLINFNNLCAISFRSFMYIILSSNNDILPFLSDSYVSDFFYFLHWPRNVTQKW